ncbi:hypothetical protein [Pseudofrankia sp. BMG5.36]|uniref:hypothetical protein n=1 Tax=Pseudofrankia sp. BMG5.36 TaxID=1834512 RepID=UPI0010424894|nr:hypothetical protein [Pseudofrankia sp. BMG5.36]
MDISSGGGRLVRLVSGCSRQLPALLVAALAVGGVVCIAVLGRSDGRPAPMPVADTAWLANATVGTVSRVNGLSARPDALVAAIGGAGRSFSVVQDDQQVYLVDSASGSVGRVDPVLLDLGGPVELGPAGTYVVTGADTYAVDPANGVVTRLRSTTLKPLGRPVLVQSAVSGAVMSADGTLWLALPDLGEVLPVRGGVAGAGVEVARPGDHLAVAVYGEGIVAVDSTDGLLIPVSGGRAQPSLRLPTLAGDDIGLLVGQAATGQVLALVAPTARALLLADLRSGHVRRVDLRSETRTGSLTAPVELGTRVYLADRGSGVLIEYDVDTGRFSPSTAVTPGPADLEVFSRGDLVWANDPAGPAAVVVDDGVVRRIVKYKPATAGAQLAAAILPSAGTSEPTPAIRTAPPPGTALTPTLAAQQPTRPPTTPAASPTVSPGPTHVTAAPARPTGSPPVSPPRSDRSPAVQPPETRAASPRAAATPGAVPGPVGGSPAPTSGETDVSLGASPPADQATRPETGGQSSSAPPATQPEAPVVESQPASGPTQFEPPTSSSQTGTPVPSPSASPAPPVVVPSASPAPPVVVPSASPAPPVVVPSASETPPASETPTPPSSTPSAAPDGPPGPVQSLRATAAGGVITVSWAPPADDSGPLVYVVAWIFPSGTGYAQESAIVTVTSYQVTGIPPETEVLIGVIAVNAAGEDLSTLQTVEVTVPAAPSAPNTTPATTTPVAPGTPSAPVNPASPAALTTPTAPSSPADP